jgi:3-oxoacyl-[acyl-carrier-protein] synthase-1/3-oxoacyl-[acyl-carrier-protein] synthase II
VSAAIIACGAISALGEGLAPLSSEPNTPARVAIAEDALFVARGFARPLSARIVLPESERNREGARVATFLERALTQCTLALDAAMPMWRTRRVGLALGTSSGSMLSADDVFAAIGAGRAIGKAEAHRASYFGPLECALRLHPSFAPATLILTACAASTVALGIATRWLEGDACDVVLAGGFDELSVFVAAGFEVLRATTGTVPPRPFAQGRDGMSVGEGAGIVALVRAAEAPRALGYVAGFGASADAVHLTAPDRTGAGLARAAKWALRDAAISGEAIDLVSAHATATPFNDAAESCALRLALGEAAKPVIHAFKAQIGHTLGAAGVLETLACVGAMQRGVLPPTPVTTEIEADVPGRVLAHAEAAPVERVLKLSAAFGGANAALVLTRTRPDDRPRVRRDAFVGSAVLVETAPSATELAARLPNGSPEKLARTDGLTRLSLAACAELVLREGPLDGAGVIVGHALATLETNASFATRLRERGVRAAEPRKFPYTSPNATAGECGAAFGWTGPGIAVGSGLHGSLEALALAIELVRAGDAERIVVVAADEIGPAASAWLDAAFGASPGGRAVREGAVAVVVSSEPRAGAARVIESMTGLESRAVIQGELGHRALAPLAQAAAERSFPTRLEAYCPWGGYARVILENTGRI